MNSDRIEEIQKETAHPDSKPVQQAPLKVRNETEQKIKEKSILDAVMEMAIPSLDPETFDALVNALNQLAKNRRISFVAKL